MAAGSKWIDSRPDDSAQKVARRALRSRLKQMWRFLVQAVEGPRSDTENVHQLRVFSRRAAAAMEIFEACLPRRRGRWMQKQVKRVRKASGQARDFDVLLLRWDERLKQVGSGETALVVDEIKRQRREAQAPIEAIHQRLVGKRFRRRIARLVDRVRDRRTPASCDQDLACMARAALAALVGPCLQAGEGPLTDAESLHAFRIQSKQVRYAMEIFGGAFDEDFRQGVYPLVAALQDRLGAINDHVTAGAYFEEWRTASDSCSLRHALELAIQFEQQSFETAKREFLAWWTSERREDFRRRFGRYVPL